MDYFYTPPEKISETSVLIDGDEFAHLVHVMRKKTGEAIRVVDGKGMAYDVTLDAFEKKSARGTILASYARHNEHAINVTLGVGVLKNPSKFDFLVEKVTELGVREIVPLHTERTIPSHDKADRWQKLALAAMKQCGRSYLPTVCKLTTLDELLTRRDLYDARMIAHEQPREDNVKNGIAAGATAMLLLVGPEGGFSEGEVQRCVASGCETLYLGERRLRTETAAIVTVAMATQLSM